MLSLTEYSRNFQNIAFMVYTSKIRLFSGIQWAWRERTEGGERAGLLAEAGLCKQLVGDGGTWNN